MLFIPATKPGVSSKLVRRWVGPFVIARKVSAKVYVLADEEGREVTTKVSVLRLKSYKDRATLGKKWLTAEYDDRLDRALMQEEVVRDAITKQLRDLIALNENEKPEEEVVPDLCC